MDLTAAELQKLVLMVGSKQALMTYLGLDQKEINQIWIDNNLKRPVAWLRDQPRNEQLEMLAKAGSLSKLADKLACSEAALRPIFMGEPVRELDWTADFLILQLERYKTVRLTAHMLGVTESLVRKCADKHELDLAELTDYSISDHSIGKGRRAELEYLKLRGSAAIIADMNKIDGPQALYDFRDMEFGRVNVKSSRRWKYKSRSRAADPYFWKISTRGASEADYLICLCYDAKGEQLLGVYKVKADLVPRSASIAITAGLLEEPSVLFTGDVG